MDLLKGKGHKQYRTAFLRLWDALIQCCYEQEVLLDDGLLETVCHLLIGLSRLPLNLSFPGTYLFAVFVADIEKVRCGVFHPQIRDFSASNADHPVRLNYAACHAGKRVGALKGTS